MGACSGNRLCVTSTLESCAGTSRRFTTSSRPHAGGSPGRCAPVRAQGAAASTKPSKANEEVFNRAVDEIAHITAHLLDDLVTSAPPATARSRRQRPAPGPKSGSARRPRADTQSGAVSLPADASPDEPLRANVRLLGSILGTVLTEQVGGRRTSSRSGSGRMRGSAAAATRSPRLRSRETVAELSLEQQAIVLRAFTLYFHLANIAEQHHRIRRRRAVERDGGVLRESLDEAIGALEQSGTSVDEIREAAARVSVELVLTAHPTEALPRTILEKHRRIGALLDRLDDPRLTPGERAAVEASLAEEITILWQTDEVRSVRPRVVDEIRQGLWFLEESLWDAAPALVETWRARLDGTPLRFGKLDRRRSRRQSERRAGDGARGGGAEPRGRARPASPRRQGARRLVGDVDEHGRRRRRGRCGRASHRPESRGAIPPATDRDLGAAGGRRVRRRSGARRRPRRPGAQPSRTRRHPDRRRRAGGAPTAARRVRSPRSRARPPSALRRPARGPAGAAAVLDEAAACSGRTGRRASTR